LELVATLARAWAVSATRDVFRRLATVATPERQEEAFAKIGGRTMTVHAARLLLTLAVILSATSHTRTQAAEAQWSVGLATVKTTPHGPIRMAGYAARKDLSESVAGDLFAKAMAIEGAGGDRGLLITVDIIGFRAPVAAALCTRISEVTGLDRRQIVLNPSHTHAGPVLALDDFNDYGLPEEHHRVSRKYTEYLFDGIVTAASEACKNMQPAKLSLAMGEASFVMNRREFTDTGVKLGVNPEGHVDKSVPVLRVESLDGELRAVLFGCACHNTTMTGKNLQICGDYAGFAQATVEKEHPGIQAMFMIGCGGAANPYPRTTLEHAQTHGETLGTEVCRVLKGNFKRIAGPLTTLLEWTSLPLAPVPDRETLETMINGPSYLRYNAERMVEALKQGKKPPTEYFAPIGLWQFGNDWTLVVLPGEVPSEFVPLIEKAIGSDSVWVAAYCNDTFGYLPTAKILREGGYETRGLIPDTGFFSPAAETITVARVLQLAKQAGRPIP
jgi:hypothetical protein